MAFEYPEGVRFSCNRCAKCCGDTDVRNRAVLMLKTEAERISKIKLLNIGEFAVRINGFDPYVYCLKKTDSGKCVFLDGDTCDVYGFRPLVCRFYPFELKEKAEGKGMYFFVSTEECPCVGRGEVLRMEYFEDLFSTLKRMMGEDQIS